MIVFIIVLKNKKYFAFISRHYFKETDTRRKVLYFQAVDGKEPVSLTMDETDSVSEFAWGPDSKTIAFTRSSDPLSIYTVNTETKKIVKQQTYKLAISMIKWSSQGNIFTFSALVYPGMSMNETASFDEEKKNNYHSSAVVFESTPLYRWDTWMNVCFFILYICVYVCICVCICLFYIFFSIFYLFF